MHFRKTYAAFFLTFVCLTYACLAFEEDNYVQPVKKVLLKKENDNYFLCIDFNKNTVFTPRIHTLSNGIKIFLSFKNNVQIPKIKKLSHRIIKGYFFDRFSNMSLMFVMAFKEKVVFLEKKYTKDSIKIRFKINKKHNIVIDPQLGGEDLGAKSLAGDYEKNIALIIAIELRNALIKSDKYRVILTRDKDVTISVNDRISKIKSSKAELLLSLCADNNKSFSSLSAHAHAGSNKKASVRSNEFLEYLMAYIPDIYKSGNHSCPETELEILNGVSPSALIKFGNISNRRDDKLLHCKSFREKIICAILYALDKFFEKGR